MAKNSCLSYIRRHIACLKPDTIFTTRDCLNYGKRSNVDNATFRLVREGVIKRLARGIFVRPSANFVFPTADQIALIKAKAFNKEMRVHGRDTASKFNLVSSGHGEPTFYVAGSTSRFIYRKKYIHLKKGSRKRLYMPDDRAGLAIRALWSMGPAKVNETVINSLSSLWNTRAEKDKIYASKAWMPAWLGDYFLTDRYVGPFSPGNPMPTFG